MKLFLVAFLVAAVSAGRLENTYLPPGSAGLAGGTGSVLAAPSVGLTTPISTPTIYSAPVSAGSFINSVSAPAGSAGSISAPGVTYGVPTLAVQAYSVPVTPPVPILRFSSDSNSDGSYRYDYETANHIAAQESGRVNSIGSNQVQGSYSYLAPNGQTITVNYVADENGFRPEGAHLPTPPPIPEAILKSLEFNAAEEARIAAQHTQYNAVNVDVAAATSGQYLPPVAATQGGYRY